MNLLFNIMNNIKLLPSVLVFAEVARRESFTSAAEHLRMSKAAVSQHVSRLEAEVGLSLLKRNTRGMSLTSAGEKLFQRSATLDEHVSAVFMELSSLENEPRGDFSVTAPHSLEVAVVLPAIQQLATEFPLLRPRLMMTDKVLDLIHHKIDVSLFAGHPKESNFKAKKIGEIKEIFCASPRYLSHNGAPGSIEDLKPHRWISVHWQSQTFRTNSEILQSTETTLEPYSQCDSLTSALEMAKNDMGVVLVPNVAALPLIQAGTLVQLKLDVVYPSWPLFFVHTFHTKKPRHVLRFQELVQYHFSNAIAH